MSVSLPSERCLEFLVRRAASPDEEEEAASKGHDNPSQQHRNVTATFLCTKTVLSIATFACAARLAGVFISFFTKAVV